MFEAIRAAVISPWIRRWLLTAPTSWRTLSEPPSGPASAVVAGPDPDRILLIGAGIAMGYGTASHELALPGRIARQVSERTGRGVHIDVVASEDLTVDTALDVLTVARLREVDVIITTPGTLESLLLMPGPTWRERVEYLLDHFSLNAPASLRVLCVAAPEMSKVVRMPRLLGWLIDRSARRLNSALEASCADRTYAQFVPFRPTERAGRDGTGRTYELWATLLAPSVAAALQENQTVSR